MIAALSHPSRGFLLTLAVLLALGHAVLGVTATVGTSVTHDEIAHLTAGRAYNTLGDFRLQPENGNLPQRWCALPMAALGATFPPLPRNVAWAKADTWDFGHRFLYQSGNNTELIILAGRAMISLFSAGTGLLIFFWSRRLFGWRGAFLSLGLFVFCPNFLAHGALATSDVTMVFFLLAAVTAWWWQLQELRWPQVLASAAVFGLACVAKFSAALLLPMMLLLALARFAAPAPAGRTRAGLAGLIGRSALVHAAMAGVIIWAFYGFRYSAFAPGTPAPIAGFFHPWDWFPPDTGVTARAVAFARHLHLLPEAFLYGFYFVSEFAQQRGAFLNGDYSIHGWVGFFPFAFLVKTPLPLLGLLVCGLGAWVLSLRRGGRAAWTRGCTLAFTSAPLLVLFVVYWAFSLSSHLNIGHRHLLPVYPVLFILLGVLGAWIDRRHPAALALVALLGSLHVADSLHARPHYVAYFNQLVGGPANGYLHLVDSSLDWGQDLPELADWLRAHNTGPAHAPVFLSYFGTGDPAYEGISATRLPTVPDLPPPRPWHALAPGVYCISATMLQQVYSPVRGPWTIALEIEYQKFRETEPTFLAYQRDPARRQALQREYPAAQWQAAWERYEVLRFNRLCQYLRARRPETVIAHTIFVYRLGAGELAAATAGSLQDLAAAIERARRDSPR